MAPADAEEPALAVAPGAIGGELTQVELQELRLASGLAVKPG
jgi:hypothetical protein